MLVKIVNMRTLQGDQSSPWFEISRQNAAVFPETHRKYCSDLLRFFRHIRNTRSSSNFIKISKKK